MEFIENSVREMGSQSAPHTFVNLRKHQRFLGDQFKNGSDRTHKLDT